MVDGDGSDDDLDEGRDDELVHSVDGLESISAASGGAMLLLVARGENNLYIPIEP